ncbi:MAG: thioredoxin family protein [Spirochaetales bacterium]|nr:thioredoxin family protein [Spirochaetales bacterium]
MKTIALLSLIFFAGLNPLLMASGVEDKDTDNMMSDDYGGTMMMSDEGGETMMMSDETMMAAGGKIDFTTLDDARALVKTGPVVLFFFADWCPTCRAAIQDINERIKSLGDISLVIVNYDKETELKSRYNVTYQHTFVQINEEGKEITKWNGGKTAEILRRVVREEEG